MASIVQSKGKWRAHVCVAGVRRSRLFPTRRAARDWAARAEYEIRNSSTIASATLFGDVLDRYAREVSPAKRSHAWEVRRIERFRRDPFAAIPIGELTAGDIALWRDDRLRTVSAATVLRDMNLLGAVLTQARREWHLIDKSPLPDVRRPKAAPPRDRLPTADEFERLAIAAGTDLARPTARAHHAFLFACETAMRAGEIVGLTWGHIDLEARVAHLPMTKNGRPRDVPMTSGAVGLLEQLPRRDPVFGLSSARLDALWRQLRERALVDGLRFHDSRAYALTSLSRRVDVMTLAKISGHRDLKILLNTYYRETAADIARRLG